MAEKEKKPSVSYYSKEVITCPVCGEQFKKELMLSGSGRVNAGDLTDELHRNYIPSAKFGAIYPLIYEVGACPKCFTALAWSDFPLLKDPAAIKALKHSAIDREHKIAQIFNGFDFHGERTLFTGTAAYYASLLTYDRVPKEMCPSMKSGIYALRAAWLSLELDKERKGEHFDYVAQVFYQKSLFYYNEAILADAERTEPSSTLSNYGPDTDKNYGWDGAVYLRGLLEYKYGQTDDVQQRLKCLDQSKSSIARMFGLGKSSKSKPGPLLENARNLYNTIGKMLKEDE